MSKILLVYERINATTEINLQSYGALFEEVGIEMRSVQSNRVKNDLIKWCDICMLLRPDSTYSLAIARAAKSSSKYLIGSFDDDIVNLPERHPSAWKKEYTISCIRYLDAIFSTSPFILQDYKNYNNHFKAIRTDAFIREEQIKVVQSKSNKIRIVYPAGVDHIGLFNKYIKPILSKLDAQYPNSLDYTFIGVSPCINDFEYRNNVHCVSSMSFENYTDYMLSNDFDIGIAPLSKNNFNERKYYIKYIEYSKFGIAGIYSDVYPYKHVVKNKINGVMVGDHFDYWFDALCCLIDNKDFRLKIVEESQKDVREHFNLYNVRKSILEQCPEIYRYNAPNKPVNIRINRLLNAVYLLKDFCNRFTYNLRKEGLVFIIKYIKRNYK